MFRYKLRTLLIVLALGPPIIWAGWNQYDRWRSQNDLRRLGIMIKNGPVHLHQPPPAVWAKRTPVGSSKPE